MPQHVLGQRHTFILGLSVVFAVLFFSFLPPLAAAPDDPRVAELKREAAKEGKVVFYTSMLATDVAMLIERFQKKYPFLKVEPYRLNNFGLLQRMVSEHKAKRYVVDVIDIKGDGIDRLKRMGLLAKYLSPGREAYREGFKDAEGYWTDTYLTVQVLIYNTNRVAAHEVPDTYQDLLKPRWKGRIGFNPENYTWPEGVLQTMGEEKGLAYMKALAEQNFTVRDGSTLNIILTAAGEQDIAVPIHNTSTEQLMARGAPVNWARKIKPYYGDIHPIALAVNAPHPNASKLFIDFLISQEGQELVASTGKTAPRSGIKSKIRSEEIIPIAADAEKAEYYRKLLKEIFRK